MEHLEVVENEQNNNSGKANVQIDKSNTQTDKLKLVVYYTDWCGFSKSFLKEWEDNLLPAVESANDVKNKVDFVKVNCEQNQAECAKNKVEGYPTIILHLSDGTVHEYKDDRSTAKILAFVRKYI
jgi:thiol-disulfide isomerase/thioredoxin